MSCLHPTDFSKKQQFFEEEKKIWLCGIKINGKDSIGNIILYLSFQDPALEVPDHKNENDLRYDTAASRLATEAVRKLSGDNVTVVIVSIGLPR